MNILVTITDNCGRSPKRKYIVNKNEWKRSQINFKKEGSFALKFRTIDGIHSTQFPCLSKIETQEINQHE